jgi:hypothetical protein
MQPKGGRIQRTTRLSKLRDLFEASPNQGFDRGYVDLEAGAQRFVQP